VSALLLSVREAAQELGLGRDSTYALVREGRLRTVRVGARVLVPRAELDAFVARETEGGEENVGNGAGNGTRPPTDAASRA
jgi:excisionase family DNA binding protein